MQKWLPLMVLVAMLSGTSLSAQRAGMLTTEQTAFLEEMEDSLALLSYAVVNDSLPDQRFLACRAMIPRLVKALKTENSFSYTFPRVESVSIQYPADSSFRIFTWQLYVDVNEYRFYGAIQLNTPELQLFPLVDRSFELGPEAEQAALSPDNWYGAVYYNLQTFATPEGDKHLLFGFDGNDYYNRRKIIDVLSFKDGKPVFGAPVFVNETKGTKRHRILLEYSAEASVRCNYDPALELLIHDHLIPLGGEEGGMPKMVPDGSYEGYELKNGRWVYIDNVFPDDQRFVRPEPILNEGTNRSVIGKNR